jgi:hypothetical protein
MIAARSAGKKGGQEVRARGLRVEIHERLVFL